MPSLNVQNIVWCEPMHKLTQKPEAILRCMKILGGTVAWSGFQIWIKIKATMSTAAITRHRITRHSLH
jgi:hypothetical protein